MAADGAARPLAEYLLKVAMEQLMDTVIHNTPPKTLQSEVPDRSKGLSRRDC